MNLRLPVITAFAVLLAGASSAQTTAGAPNQQPSSGNQMTTTPAPKAQEFPEPSAADAARCAGKIPEGGVPNYIRVETDQQRKDRIGTNEDPGCDPDQTKEFWRFGKAYTIGRYERRFAAYDSPDPNYIRPFGPVFTTRELYQQNQQYVWVWEPVRTPEEINPPIDVKKSTQGG